MYRIIFTATATLLVLSGCTAPPASEAAAEQANGTAVQESADRGVAALIADAERAAPASISRHATIVDHQGAVLREGSNGWVCMPDMTDVPNDSPMCLDAPWREVIDAWMNRREPRITRMGFGYMLQGDLPTSNIDPFATAPTADNQWLQNGGPHVMIVLPQPTLLDGLPTDPANGGPWVMWKGSPYAHIMVPAPQLGG